MWTQMRFALRFSSSMSRVRSSRGSRRVECALKGGPSDKTVRLRPLRGACERARGRLHAPPLDLGSPLTSVGDGARAHAGRLLVVSLPLPGVLAEAVGLEVRLREETGLPPGLHPE